MIILNINGLNAPIKNVMDKRAGSKYILFTITHLNFNNICIFNIKGWKEIYYEIINPEKSRSVYISIKESRLQSKENN